MLADELAEVGQNSQAYRLAFFRVKLGGKDIARPHTGGERQPILRGGGNNRRVIRDRIIRMHEIHARALGHAVEMGGRCCTWS